MAAQGHKNAPKSLLYTDFSDDAPWKRTVMNHSQYIACTPPAERSPWMAVGGFALELCYRDWMHNDFLGTARDHLASLIFDMASEGLLGPGPLESQLKRLSCQLHAWCWKHRVSISFKSFTKASLGRPNNEKTVFPEMASYFKASHLKIIARFLAEVARRRCTGSLRSKVRVVCIWGLTEAHHIMDSCGVLLIRPEARRLRGAIYVWLRTYSYLHCRSQIEGTFLYYIRPKHHYCEHAAMDLHPEHRFSLNPRFTSCWVDESFLGKCMRIGKRTHASTCSLRLLQRYILYIALRWEKRRRCGRLVL